MSPGLKTLAAVLAAAAMVGAAIVGRGALDTKKERDELRLTVACDPIAEQFCKAAAAADPRITLRVEPPDVTTKRLSDLSGGEPPPIDAWITAGPWLQMADGRRSGQAPLQRGVAYVASTPVVIVTRPGQTIGPCENRPPAACLPLPRSRVGLASPRTSGVGLAGLAKIVLARTGTPVGDLDRTLIESGDAARTIEDLRRANNPSDDLGRQLAANFSEANPVITIQPAAVAVAGRVAVVPSEPQVRAVIQVGVLDDKALLPLGGSERGGQALAKAATEAGWDPPGEHSGGLPDPGVLAALQDAWRGP